MSSFEEFISEHDFTDEQKERIMKMYKTVHIYYHDIFPKCTFFTPEFVLHKIATLLGVTTINIPILKSELTLRIMDDRWRIICNRAGWIYIPSFNYP
jgi:hypothetical protein